MKFTFEHWLLKQKERQDRIGGLARAISRIEDDHFPRRKFDEHKKWADLMIRHGLPEHVPAFNQAWREYKTAV